MLSGSVRTKAARKTLMKSTHEVMGEVTQKGAKAAAANSFVMCRHYFGNKDSDYSMRRPDSL